LLFKKSAAVSVTEDRKLQAIFHSNVGMIQTVVDHLVALKRIQARQFSATLEPT